MKAEKMSTIPLNNYEEIAELLRDFMQDYSWLFNFSNINIIIDDFVGKVNIITLLRNHVERKWNMPSPFMCNFIYLLLRLFLKIGWSFLLQYHHHKN